MAALMKVLGLVVMAVVPGGLLVLAAFVLGRALAAGVKVEQGTAGRRVARAVVNLKWRDVWAQARALPHP
jgi:hypothetical protein